MQVARGLRALRKGSSSWPARGLASSSELAGIRQRRRAIPPRPAQPSAHVLDSYHLLLQDRNSRFGAFSLFFLQPSFANDLELFRRPFPRHVSVLTQHLLIGVHLLCHGEVFQVGVFS